MITWPVVTVRAWLTTALVWGLGAAATVGAFKITGASTTIRDANSEPHTQVIWLGSHAFFACAGTVLGLSVAGSAAVNAFLARPAGVVARVAVPLLLACWVVVGVLRMQGALGETLALAIGVGCLIGILCGAAYLLLKGVPDEDRLFYRPAQPETRSWGSR